MRSLVTPVRTKSKIPAILGLDFVVIAAFYLLVSLTGIFAFDRVTNHSLEVLDEIFLLLLLLKNIETKTFLGSRSLHSRLPASTRKDDHLCLMVISDKCKYLLGRNTSSNGKPMSWVGYLIEKYVYPWRSQKTSQYRSGLLGGKCGDQSSGLWWWWWCKI